MPRVPRSTIYAAVAVIALVVVAVVFITDAQTPRTPTALPLTKTFDDSPSGFTFQYPDDWEYMIPVRGVLVLGPPQTLNETEPGPTLMVQRAEPLSVAGSLDAALTRFLEQGPMRTEGRWTVTEAAQDTTFEGREARAITVEGSDVDGGVPLRAEITATSSDNTFIYFIVVTMPAEKREQFAPTMDAIVATIQILE